jgi:hypothetical protein
LPFEMTLFVKPSEYEYWNSKKDANRAIKIPAAMFIADRGWLLSL